MRVTASVMNASTAMGSDPGLPQTLGNEKCIGRKSCFTSIDATTFQDIVRTEEDTAEMDSSLNRSDKVSKAKKETLVL